MKNPLKKSNHSIISQMQLKLDIALEICHLKILIENFTIS